MIGHLTDADRQLFYRGRHCRGGLCLCAGTTHQLFRTGVQPGGGFANLAGGRGEREAALAMLSKLGGRRRRTLAADKAYDTADFVAACRALGVTPHVAQNTNGRRSAIDGRTTRHAGYGLSLKIRAWIETHFGWLKAAAGLRQVKQRGLERVDALFQLAMAASNLVRLPKLLATGSMA